MHYQKMEADEDSRRALAGCIDWKSFSLTKAKIIDGTAIYDTSYPALSLVYPDTTATNTEGYFKYGNHYVLPKQHLYVLSLGVSYYNKDEVINPGDGTIYSGVTEDDIIFSPTISVKNKSTRELYEDSYTGDPFNKASEDNPCWTYIENRIIIGGASNSIRYINIQVVTLPTVDQAFSASTYGSSTAPARLTFAEHYQKQIIQMAVKRMTQTDVGLMTPPSN